MASGSLQKTQVRILLTMLTAAMMAMIFFFSTETAERSDRTSGSISMAVISVLYPDYENLPAEKMKEIYDNVQYSVRKTAHFTEYLILGVLMRLCLESWFGRRKLIAPVSWASGSLYACTDELHQMMIDGRSGLWTDVLLDSFGVLTGVIGVTLILVLLKEMRIKKNVPEHCTGKSGNPPEHW